MGKHRVTWWRGAPQVHPCDQILHYTETCWRASQRPERFLAAPLISSDRMLSRRVSLPYLVVCSNHPAFGVTCVLGRAAHKWAFSVLNRHDGWWNLRRRRGRHGLPRPSKATATASGVATVSSSLAPSFSAPGSTRRRCECAATSSARVGITHSSPPWVQSCMPAPLRPQFAVGVD